MMSFTGRITRHFTLITLQGKNDSSSLDKGHFSLSFFNASALTTFVGSYLKKKISITIAYFWKIHQIGIVQKDYKNQKMNDN
ncbi:hypothetical protein Y1Q_0003425 [Alligator mississippiensis]|uniref:Uncharacterized protein n=1 Tax=Alligator mississippiensis TaxID=8496 RepID=A0A151N4Z6_ALLMI|nr:hypothetical protein Y1Q_0003425 [Alligator mississippiensis]